jgi:signal transduction histidine kinase
VSRRIIGSFLAVLLGLLALVVVPLGVSLSTRERRDFTHSADGSARSLAAAAEETLGDRGDSGDSGDSSGQLRLPVDPGDAVAVLDRHRRPVPVVGTDVSTDVIAALEAGRRPKVADAVVSTAVVGQPSRPDGFLVLVRQAEPVDRRIRTLWLGLAAAAAISLCVGGLVAIGLARWIVRPLRELHAVAVRMGHGAAAARVAEPGGAPEVHALALAFNEMASRIESLLTSQRVMTAEVSHQLRTPLAALRLQLELVTDDAPDGLRAELLDALREISRLSRLADGLLAVARADEVEASPEQLDVAGVVADRVEFWGAVAAERGVELSSRAQPALAMATPGHLEQVLDNLIANCLDALDPGRSVAVTVERAGDEVVLAVVDDGPGMSQAHRIASFGRFVSDRSGPTKSGLGLAIVARLVQADQGSIGLEETPGGGLTAVIRLPASGDHVKEHGLAGDRSTAGGRSTVH